MMKSTDNLFSLVADSFANHFERIFHRCYPCDRGSKETLQEANLTTNLLRAFIEKDSSLFTWDEFPIPSSTKIDSSDDQTNRIDSVIIDSEEKTIFMIESKCLGRSEEQGVISCSGIAKDVARMINAANEPSIFPDRIWQNDGLQGKPIPIGNGYNDYSVFGIAACGVWWPDKQKTCKDIEALFRQGFSEAMNGIYSQRPFLKDELGGDEIEVREIALPDILLEGKKWQYFVILYKFKILNVSIKYSPLMADVLFTDEVLASAKRRNRRAGIRRRRGHHRG